MKFQQQAMTDNHPNWHISVSRQNDLYNRNNFRSQFYRDYTRILHSNAYRRLKHKTQVFFSPDNDHICTRIEHVNHVASVSYTIAQALGLNLELTNVIANGHDLGHAPFGHVGEKIIKNIVENDIGHDSFWHEKNSLWFIDKIETLPNPEGCEVNLNLTYAVRDGIVLHCGEIDENGIKPRQDYIDLESITNPGQFQPFTWEGCVVKISDKIAYLGRDIEDALALEILDRKTLDQLQSILTNSNKGLQEINNTVIMNDFIVDLYQQSDPEIGIRFSNEKAELMKQIKDFNYHHIYLHPKLRPFENYANLVIETIYKKISSYYEKEKILSNFEKDIRFYPRLLKEFTDWLVKYSNIDLEVKQAKKYNNAIVYDINNKHQYKKSVIDYISGMTDSYSISVFNEIIRI